MGEIKSQLTKLNFSRNTGGSYINLDFTDLGEKLEAAQHRLDFMVLRDMLKYVPNKSGRLVEEIIDDNNNAPEGVIFVYPATLPYGHYQWEGMKYVWPEGMSPYKGGRKVMAFEPLNYPSNPNDYAAIRDYKDRWIYELQKMFN